MVPGTYKAAEAPASWSKTSPYRTFSLSPGRVEVRLYRRSRNSSSVTQQPCHFEYFLRCHWTGSPKCSQESDVSGNWWDELPASYDIRRRWPDIVRFHEELVELASSLTGACRTRMPELPNKGNLNEFTNHLAATGDAGALGKGRLNMEDSSHCELSILHSIYVENYLAPYFTQVSAILREISPQVLFASKAIRQFATAGPSSLQRRSDQAFDQSSLEAASRALRESQAWREGASGRRRSAPIPTAAAVQAGDGGAGGQSAVPGRRSSSNFNDTSDAASLAAIVQRTPPKELPRDVASHSSSHYNCFASMAASEAFGCPSDAELIRRMVAKERREKAHQTLLEPDSRHLNPSERSMQERPTLLRNPPTLLRSSPCLLGAGKSLSEQPTTGAGTCNPNLRLQIVMADICVGLRTMILGEATPDGQRGRQRMQPVEIKAADKSEGSPERVLILYHFYRRLLEEDTQTQGSSLPEPGDARDVESDDESLPGEDEQRQRKQENERMSYIRDFGVLPEVMPVCWQAVFMFIDHKIDLADDCRVRSTYAALLRALKYWKQTEATVAQSYLGVSLNMLFQWIWPRAAFSNVQRMLTWIGQHEFEKIRQPTPPVIGKEDQLHIENIFSLLDVQRNGVLTAEDVAGRTADSVKAKLRNIVDADTVKAVYGSGPITLDKFLEIMCEDNFRGHEDATVAQLSDGSRLVKVERQVMACSGWILQDAPRSEESQRDLVDAIEIEVARWSAVGPHLDNMRRRPGEHSMKRLGCAVDPWEHMPTTLAKLRQSLSHGAGVRRLSAISQT